MKKMISLYALMLVPAFSISLHAQKTLKPKTQEEVVAALCHHWRLTALEEGGMKLPPSIKVGFTEITLNRDGTFVKTVDREPVSGTWVYQPKGMVLQTEDKSGVILFAIIRLTETELVYKTKIGGLPTNVVLERVQ